MRRLLLTSMCLALFSSNALAADWSWSGADVGRQFIYLAADLNNWNLVTGANQKAAKYAGYGMTDQPSQRQLNTYFILGAVVHTAIAAALPKGYREPWQYIGIGVQLGVTGYGLGMSVSLK